MTHNESDPENTSVHNLFELQVQRTPDAVAVVFGPDRLSYQDLNRRVNQLAHHLRSVGVGPNVLVALAAERSLEALIGLLAVLKAGGAYVPVDPAYPRDRVSFMLEDAAAPVLLTQARLLSSLPRHRAHVVLLDRDREAFARWSNSDPTPLAGPDDLAYVIYTSGSTGKPKGTMLSHRGVVNLALAEKDLFSVGPGSRVLQFASFSFDASVWEILMALVTGATLIMGPRSAMVPGPELLDLLRTEEVSVATLMVPVLAAMPEGAESTLPALRTVIVAGEACHRDLVARWAPGRRFFNAYGPTEASCGATVAECTPDGADPPIGQPIPNTTCLVLDTAMEPVADGEPGELYLGGVGLARGYLGRPGLTAARFIPDPFSAAPGARLYRTGDRVRRLPSGDLAFLGRVDDQVKIRGHRVELGEVDAALALHPAIRAAAVVAREGRLVAYVAARPQEAASSKELTAALRRHLREQLPEPMVPAAFVLLDALPLTPSGKVDRAALSALEIVQPAREDEELAPPRSEVEATIAAAWTELLGLEQLGIHEDVFDLGGHSLLVARLMLRLRHTLGVEIPIQSLFEARTVAALAAVVASLPTRELAAATPKIEPAPRDRPMPLSEGQHQIWLHALLHPGALFYNEPFSIRMAGPLDQSALERAFEEVLRRHEILRTRFTRVGGEPVQQIDPPGPFTLSLVEFSALPVAARWERALEFAAKEACNPFDLERGPLFRASLVRLDEADHVLFITAHHILMDGLSAFDVLQKELQLLYQAFSAGRPSPLPELMIQYADYAVWQREHPRSGVLAAQLDYWKRQLDGLTTLELPTDRPRRTDASSRGARHCIALSRDLTLRLKAVAREQGVTLFTVLLSAFKAMLYRYARQDEIVIGTSASCRDQPGTEDLVGFFLNTLVLRTDLRGDPTFRELLGRVRDVSQAALAHQNLSFASVVQALQPKRVPGQNPLFQVAFVLEPPVPALDPAWSVSQLDVDTNTSKFDLTMELDERPEGIIGRIEYNTDLFDPSTVERLAGHYGSVLEGASNDVHLRLSAMPLLKPAERRSLREQSFAPPGAEADACLHRLFEAQVERSPDAIALVFDHGAASSASTAAARTASSTSITYRDLNERANQLAHALLDLGTAPEDRVAICMGRSIETIVAMLGVLKAGLAFVPLDPEYPADRLSFMLEQAQAQVILTQARLADALPPHRARVLCLDTASGELDRHSRNNPVRSASPEQLAYVMYTSGSTGKPKGVAVPHRAVARLVKGTSYASFTPEEVFLQLASVSFDAATFEIWGALLNGGRLVLMPPAPPSVEELLRVLHQHQVTTVWLTAGLFHLLVDERLSELRGLRQLLAGGDVLSPQHVNRVLAELPECRMINGYGPTESTTFACCSTVERPVDHTVPIGRPIPGTKVVVLDPDLNEVPAGVPGELCIGGAGLSRGYFGRADWTAERFIPDPTGSEPGGRLYRSGDRVRLMPDGQFEFLGRIDQQVKVRGYRIELGEIEGVMSAHPAVRDSVVTARADRSGDKRLIAYVVPHNPTHGAEPAEVIERSVLDHLRRRLPSYMHPAAVVLLDTLPLTGNGKVDRRALPAPEGARPASVKTAPPRSQLEERLAVLWQEVLGLDHVGVLENFFDLGGHSLLLMRLHERIRESLRVDLSIVDLFARPTIHDLAAFLSSGSPESDLSQADARALKQREILRRKKQAASLAKNKPYGSA